MTAWDWGRQSTTGNSVSMLREKTLASTTLRSLMNGEQMERLCKAIAFQILLAVCVGSCFGQVVSEYTERSVSFEEDLEARGFSKLSAELVIDGNGRPITGDMVMLSPKMDRKEVSRYWVGYVTMSSELGVATNYNLKHAVEFDLLRHEKLLTTDDAGCSSTAFPRTLVIAVGKWYWRSNPRMGGYSKSIRLAWIADPQKQRLVRIPEGEVTCSIDSDRD